MADKVFPNLAAARRAYDHTLSAEERSAPLKGKRTHNFSSTVGDRHDLIRQIHQRNSSLGYEPARKKPKDECWKDDAWVAYENIEAIGFAIDTVAKSVAAGKLVVGVEESNGVATITDAELPNQILRQFKGPYGCDSAAFMENAATVLQISGDGYFVAHKVPASDRSDEQASENDGRPDYREWEFVSDQEISIVLTKDKQTKVIRDDSGSYQAYGSYFSSHDNSFVFSESKRVELKRDRWYVSRSWKPSKRFSQLSDSALKKNLGIVKEIMKLNSHIHSVIDSKMPAGMVVIPEEITFGASDIILNPAEHENGEPAEYLDRLDVEFIEHYIENIEDHASPENLVPLLIRGAAEYLSEIRYIDVSKDLDIVSHRIRDELFERLFIGLDIPKEIIEGKGSLNHWTGKNIDGNLTSNHVIPLGKFIAREITKHYLRPMLVQHGMDYQEAEKYSIMYDASDILPRADKSTIAMKLYELEIISEEALLLASGFELTDAPDENERRQRLIFKLILSSPVTLAPLLMPRLDGLEEVAEELQAIRDAQEAEGQSGPFRNKRASEPSGDDGRGRGLKSLLPKTQDDNAPRQRRSDNSPSEARRQESDAGPPPDPSNKLSQLSDVNQEALFAWIESNMDSIVDLNPLLKSLDTEEIAEMVVGDSPVPEPVTKIDDSYNHKPEGLIETLALAAGLARSQTLAIATQRVQGKIKRFDLKHLDPTDDRVLSRLKSYDLELMETSMDELLKSSPLDSFTEHVLGAVGDWMFTTVGDKNAGDIAPILTGLIVSDIKAYIAETYNVSSMTQDEALAGPSEIIWDNIKKYYEKRDELAPVLH